MKLSSLFLATCNLLIATVLVSAAPHAMPEDDDADTLFKNALELSELPQPTPRRGLWASAERIDEIRTAMAVAGSHHQRATEQLRNWVDSNATDIIDVPSRLGTSWNIDRSYLAQKASLLSLLESNTTEQQHYATIAYDALWAMYADPDSGGHSMLGSAQHLSKATVAMGFAVAYEFAYDLWTQEQRDWVLFKMNEALDGWINLSHPNFSGQFSSNWLAVVRGAELSMMLSAGQEAERPERYGQLREWLLSNAETHGAYGWGQEGNFYVAFGQIYAWPAKIAAANIGDVEMKLALSDTQHHWLALYGSAYSEDFDTINWGVGGSIWDGGFVSLAMAMAPAAEQPYARWFIDHFFGVNSLVPEVDRFDRDQQGRVWSILFYPDKAEPRDPDEFFPTAIEDRGGFFMRSGWENEHDVVVFLGTDRSSYSPGWDAPDALSLVVLGNGQRYITGPGNSAYQATARDLFSTILVDNSLPTNGSTGGREWFGLANEGAYAIATGGSQYSNIGVSTAHRHVLADFSGDSGNTALLSMLDRLRSSGGTHEYRWQINTSNAQVLIDEDAGLPTFTISRPGNDGFLRGWVVHPANAQLQTASGRLFFNVDAVDTDIWVVMAVGEGSAPAGTVSGSGLATQFALNGVQLSYDSAANRLQNSGLTFTAPPTASFTASPISGPAPLLVTVNAAGSAAEAGIVSYHWDFGDGTTATGVSASHTFTNSGTRQISLRVVDANGLSAVANRTVHVGYRWPSASFSVSPSTGQPPLEVTINPGATQHPNGLPLIYEWNLGDGTMLIRYDNSSFTHTFDAGNFPIRLVIRDENGGFDSSSRSVTVANRAPEALADWSIGGGEVPLTVQFSAARSYDIDGDPITWLWDFGDGKTSSERDPIHTFNEIGDYIVMLTVSDDKGAASSSTPPSPISVRSLNDPVPALEPAEINNLSRGLFYEYFFNDIENGSDRVPFYLTPDLLTLLWNGVIDNFKIWPADRADRIGFRYRGFIDIPETGVYTFYIQSRNGALLTVAGEELVRDNTRFGTVNEWKTLTLSAGLHPVELIFYGNEDGTWTLHPYLELTWSGPGFSEQGIPGDLLYWRGGRPEADFVYSCAPESLPNPQLFNFEASSSRAFGGDTIVAYEWEFPGAVIKNGRTVSHTFPSGNHRVILNATTSSGATATSAKTIEIPSREDYEIIGGVDRALMPGKIVRSRGEYLPNGLASGAFDGDKTTRWLDLVLNSWIEIEFRHEGQLQPYVIDEYRLTSLTNWNERDPFSWNLYGSNDGENWTLIDAVTGNSFGTGKHPRTKSFPISNPAPFAIYRFADIQATATGTSPDAVGLNLIELIDYGSQSSGLPPIAQFSTSTSTPAIGQTVSFDGSNSGDPEGYPLYFHWNFGDGQTREGWELRQVDYIYHSIGTQTVVLSVRDALGGQSQASAEITSSVVPNSDPVATYSYVMAAPTGYTEVTLDASASFDPDGDPISIRWQLGDGTVAEGPTVTHTFPVGSFAPLLIVEDDRGGRGTFSEEIIISLPQDPPLSIGINFSGRSNEFNDYLFPNEVAGIFPQANWNNISNFGETTVTTFSDARGDPALMSLNVEGSGVSLYGSNTIPRSADHRLMRTGTGAVNGQLNFVNVPYAVYDVYVYHSARREENARDDVWSMRMQTATLDRTRWIRQTAWQWDGLYNLTEAASSAEAVDGENVVVFRDISDRNFSLSSTSHQGRTLAHAIQIVDASGGTIVPPINPPTVPLALTGEALSSSLIALNWTEPEFGTVSHYRIERSPAGGSTWSSVGTVTKAAYTDTDLPHSTEFQFRVFAVNSGGESPAAGPVAVATLPPPFSAPETPVGLSATPTSASTIFLEWEATQVFADGYRVQRSIEDSGSWSQIATVTQPSFNDTTLLPSTRYHYRVLAFNLTGDSNWSSEVNTQTLGEFGSGEEITVISWGGGKFFHNDDGLGRWANISGNNTGMVEIDGVTTGFNRRPFSAAAVNPDYTPLAPPSPIFRVASVTLHGLGNTSSPSVYYRMDGRISDHSETAIRLMTTTSSSAFGAHWIWWEREHFLGGFNDSSQPLDADRTYAVVQISSAYHMMVQVNGTVYISQALAPGSSVPLAGLVWTSATPQGGEPLDLFANVDENNLPISAENLTFGLRELSAIEAIGVYVERIDSTDERSLNLTEFRVVSVLPDPVDNFAAWQNRVGFTSAELSNPLISGPMADPLNSGISHLVRHALGMGRFDLPSNWLSGIELIEDQDQLFWSFGFPQSLLATDVTVTVVQSPDLLDWQPINESLWQLLTTQPQGSEDVQWLEYRLPVDGLAPDSNIYLKLQVELEE